MSVFVSQAVGDFGKRLRACASTSQLITVEFSPLQNQPALPANSCNLAHSYCAA